MAAFLLVHNPLLGPASWSWVAAELRQRGHEVAVPSLVAAAESGRWEACADAAAAERAGPPAVIVGHSGAGPLLPAVAARVGGRPRLVFVDAPVPPLAGDTPPVPAEFLDALRGLAHEGVLPQWSAWFPPGTVEQMVGDAGRRAVVLAEQPRVPIAYFERPVPAPAGWDAGGGGYVLLSEPYRRDAAAAGARRWPVVELSGGHLDLVARPGEVAAALARLAGGPGGPRQVTLRSEDDGRDHRRLVASVTAGGDLVIEGHDLGPGVERFFGEGTIEYEWSRRVPSQHVGDLVTGLGGVAGDDVLDLLARRFSGPDAARLDQALDATGVPVERWSRTGD